MTRRSFLSLSLTVLGLAAINLATWFHGSSSIGVEPMKDKGRPTPPSKPRELRVLMSTNEPLLTKLFTEVLKKEIGESYVLRVVETPAANELMEKAQSYRPDIFILILNNMLFPINNPPEARIEKALNVVSKLNEKYRKPIMALAGWPKGQGFAEKAKLAGATFFFELPVDLLDFREAIKKCLAALAED